VGTATTVSSPGPTSSRVTTSSTSVEPLPSTTEEGGTPQKAAVASRTSSPELGYRLQTSSASRAASSTLGDGGRGHSLDISRS
jgi:hypothetical protein